ncbi:MAG: hypothetical protein AAF456_15660 [Planctomycetota bacterium]
MFKSTCCFVVVLLLFVAGCGGEAVPELATVSGTITMNGEPLDQVKVTFMPDAERGNGGRSSYGETDENGRYTLTYQLPGEPQEGAAVGWHKVCLRDLIPTRARDEGGQQIPRRISGNYSNAPKTPLEFEVKAGDQVIDITALPN